MQIKSNLLCSIITNELNAISNGYPTVYEWLIANSKRVGMHPIKVKRELAKTLNQHNRLTELDLKTTLAKFKHWVEEGEYGKDTPIYFVEIRRFLSTITGRQIVAKHIDKIAMREEEYIDYTRVICASKLYDGTDETFKKLDIISESFGPAGRQFEVCNEKTDERQIIKFGKNFKHKTVPTYIEEVAGFYIEDTRYIQRNGIEGSISSAHKDFKDWKDEFLLFINTDEQLKAAQAMSVDSYKGETEFATMKHIPKDCYVYFNA